jgi:preprotein translocase subunit SecA
LKETARRFKDNTEITVTVSPLDRELSATKSYITLDGENAIWANS